MKTPDLVSVEKQDDARGTLHSLVDLNYTVEVAGTQADLAGIAAYLSSDLDYFAIVARIGSHFELYFVR